MFHNHSHAHSHGHGECTHDHGHSSHSHKGSGFEVEMSHHHGHTIASSLPDTTSTDGSTKVQSFLQLFTDGRIIEYVSKL